MSKSHSDKTPQHDTQPGIPHSNALVTRGGHALQPPLNGPNFKIGAMASGPVIQMKKSSSAPAATPKTLCEIIADEIKIDKANIIFRHGIRWEPHDLGPRIKLHNLCVAIEKKDKKNIPKLNDIFLGSLHILDLAGIAPRKAGPVMNRDREDEIAARLRLMGLEKEADKIHLRKRPIHGGWMRGGAYDWESRKNSMKKLIEIAAKEAGAVTDEASAEKVIASNLLVFKILLRQLRQIDKSNLEFELKMDALGGSYSHNFRDTLADFFKFVMHQMRTIAVNIQTPFQFLMDSLISKLGAATDKHNILPKEHGILKKHNESLRQLIKAVIDEFSFNIGLLSETVDYTKTDWDKMQATDYFEGKGSKKHKAIGITFYDSTKKKKSGKELQLTVNRLLIHRDEQLSAIEKIYNADNLNAIKAMPGSTFKLHSIDDWRNFVSAKYDDLLKVHKGDDVKALFGVVDTISLYLKAFTYHTGYNIEDFSSKPNSLNYLKRTFPRGLSGKIAHDCGVYALRVAYILSKVREKMGLDFRFVLLPAHIALAIVKNGLPIITVNNNTFKKTDPKLLAAIKKNWEQTDQQGKFTGTAHGEGDDQFIAEFTAKDFLGSYEAPDLSGKSSDREAAPATPYKILKVPDIKSTDKKEKDKYWKFYSKVVKNDLFNDKRVPKALKQFHLKYLAYLKMKQTFWNNNVYPFWNIDFTNAWKKYRPELIGKEGIKQAKAEKTVAKLKKDDEKRVSVEGKTKPFTIKKDEYRKFLKESWQNKIHSGLYSLESFSKTISNDIKSNPKLLKSGVGVAYLARANEFSFYYFEKEFIDYHKLLGNTMPDLWNTLKRPVYESASGKKAIPSGIGEALIPPTYDYQVEYMESQF